MVAILNFMYHGEVNVNQEDLQNFLAAAEELRIKGLSQASIICSIQQTWDCWDELIPFKTPFYIYLK